VIQRSGAATFYPKINTKDVLGNGILYGEWHAYIQFKSQMTNCFWRKFDAPLRWITNFLFPWFVYSNFFHSPFFNSTFSTIHPSKGWFTLTEGWFILKNELPFKRVIHPYRRVIHPQGWIRLPFFKGESSFEGSIHPSRRVIHGINFSKKKWFTGIHSVQLKL
jgi:hypothetical protein